MKHTKIAGFVFGLGLILIAGSSDINAALPREIDLLLKPTTTPTSIIIKKIIDPNLIKVLTTNTPTPTTTSQISPTIESTPTATPTETIDSTITETPEITPTETQMVVTTIQSQEDKSGEVAGKTQSNLTYWFLLITIGLLAIIIVIQAWPKKDSEES